MLEAVGWLLWGVTAYLAVSFAYGSRKYVRTGRGFHWATAVQTLFWWTLVVVFAFAPTSRLHLLWLLPLCYVGARFLVLAGIPIVTPVVKGVTYVFMRVVLAGTSSSEK